MDGVYDTDERERDERERRLDATITAWNEFDARHGAFADQYLDDFGLPNLSPPP